MRFYPERISSQFNPLLGIDVLPLLSQQDCRLLVEDAEEHGRQFGWTTSRHKTHATTDIPIERLPRGSQLWRESIAPRIAASIGRRFGFRKEEVKPVDVFLVRYTGGGQNQLSIHRDGALMTFSLLLNEAADFEGGGTYFEEDGLVFRHELGTAVLHSGKVRHGGYPIFSGSRYILVGFCLVESERLTPLLGEWRWGDPRWYLSSSIVGDEEILNRIYDPHRDAAAPPNALQAEEDATGGAGGAAGAGAGEVPRAVRGAENPKYRQAAMDIAERVKGRLGTAGILETRGGRASYEEEVGEGMLVRCYSDKEDGDLACLLLKDEKVVGHVLAKDAGQSDGELEETIRRLFSDEHHGEGTTGGAGGAGGAVESAGENEWRREKREGVEETEIGRREREGVEETKIGRRREREVVEETETGRRREREVVGQRRWRELVIGDNLLPSQSLPRASVWSA
eukprot:753336-Hanusia_phi.AAC.6